MATAYEILSNKIQTLAQTPNYQASANILLQRGLQMSLDEVIRVDYLGSGDLLCFRNLIAFIRYLGEAPKGSGYQGLKDEYINALNCTPNDCKNEVTQFISSMFLGALSKELEVQNINDLKVWVETYAYIKAQNVQIQPFEDNLSMKFSTFLWEVIGESEKDIQKCTDCVTMAAFAQNKQLNLVDVVSSLISSIYTYLSMKYEIYNGGGKNNLKEISNLVYQMKKLQVGGDMEKNQIKQLEDFFGASPIATKQEKPEKDFVRSPDLIYGQIDFSTLSKISTLYARTTNPNFNIVIEHNVCSIRGDVALKVYEIKNPSYDTNNIKNEIDILETLSAISTQSNCFIKCYGSFWQQGRFYISMEYYKDTLMTVISDMKLKNQQFDERYMIYYSRELISAHAQMEQLGIFHQDIKPQNILVTPNWTLKIIDFSVSVSKSYDEGTLAATGIHYIQGTQGYMAPELQAQALNSNRVQVKYRRGKADVYSLGLVLLQMYTLEEIHTLNLKENYNLLIQKIEKLPFAWFQTLLKNMLKIDYNERASFKKALNFIPGGKTTI